MRRWLVLPSVLVGAIAVGAAAWVLLAMPLVPGSTYAPDPVGLLATESSDDANDGEARTRYVYRHELGATVLTLTTIRNDGPFAPTLLGLGDSPLGADQTSLVWAERLLAGTWPDMVGPEDALPLEAMVIEPGQTEAVWIVWRSGSYCPPGAAWPYLPGSGIIVSSMPLRWSSLGVPRTSTIDLQYDVELRNPIEDPQTICPG